MNEQKLTTLEQVCCFFQGTEPVGVEIRGKDECYASIERTLLLSLIIIYRSLES